MRPTNLLRILFSLSLILNFYFWFWPKKEYIYERDERVLKEIEEKRQEILRLQVERDSLKTARVPIKEKIVYRYVKLKEDEKVIPTLGLDGLDSIVRSGF